MKSQLTLGLIFDVGKYTHVVAINAPVAVPVAAGATVRVVPELQKQGVQFLPKTNTIKFPKKGSFWVILVTDPDFNEVTVRISTKELAMASTVSIDKEAIGRRVSAIIDKIDPEGELGKLISLFLDETVNALFKRWWKAVSVGLIALNGEKLSAELTALAERVGKDIPAPESE